MTGVAESSFIFPDEAVEKLRNSADSLKKQLDRETSPDLLAACVYCLALQSQSRILSHLNDENFYCRVPWDAVIGLPRHPSLAADVAKCAEVFDLPSGLKALLKSLSGLTQYSKQTMKCVCGGREREVNIQVMVNTIMKIEGEALTVKVFVGVASKDQGHLSRHYTSKGKNIQNSSRADENIYIIFECRNELTINAKGELVAVKNFLNHADEFVVSVFHEQIKEFVRLQGGNR